MKYSEIISSYLSDMKTCEIKSNLILCHVHKDKLIEMCQLLYKTRNLKLKSIKAVDERLENGEFKIFYIFGIPHEVYFPTIVLHLRDTLEFPSLVNYIHESAYYESEIASFFGLIPIGHPRLQQFILHENWPANIYPLRQDFKWNTRPVRAQNLYHFQEIKGEGIYEIPVGPIHAGIIEPGHFRFSVAGEEIVHLEPKLGYTHKGSEKLFEVLSFSEKIKLAEHISGDSSISHAMAYCQAVETLSNTQITKRAKYIRVLFAELERIANHINDVGFILNDTGFSFGGSNGQRLKEKIMQLNELLCGNRFFRGVIVAGGVTKDITDELQLEIVKILTEVRIDFSEIALISEDSETVINRLKKTGILEKQIAIDHGVVGVAARASGISIDARLDFPYSAYKDLIFKMALRQSGDVYARFAIRIEEIFTSIDIALQVVKKLKKKEPIQVLLKPMEKNSYALSITEGWRGDIVYFVSTDKNGIINRVAVRDPSFMNWPAVPYAVVGNVVPDFPLINKSFNLSYSGFDR